MAWLLIGLIRAYRIVLSPVLGNCCRFYPSCSSFAIEAIETQGCFRGIAIGMWRVVRCNPFHPGGADPVPPCPLRDGSRL